MARHTTTLNSSLWAEPKPADEISETEISDPLKEQFRILNRPKPSDIQPGKQCSDPYICEFYDHCDAELRHPSM